jgi:peptidoglycan/LPS O-acetylase OafA/YrhL
VAGHIEDGLTNATRLPGTQLSYRADIDGLRAIAVSSVVIFHAFPEAIRGGFIGVDVFFVISGYLISTLIIRGLDRGRFRLAEFYSRRIRRIFPALLLVLAASVVIGWFVLLIDEYTQLGKHVAAGAGFVSNLVLWNESGYFDNSAATKPLLHLWSLAIEEQFYLIWPIIIYLLWRFPRAIWTVIVAVGLISFSLNVLFIHTGGSVAAFYSPQTRFWELMAGSAVAYVMLRKEYIAPSLQVPLLRYVNPSFLGCAFLAVGLIVTREARFPGWFALLPVIGASLIISSNPNSWINRVFLSHPFLVGLGLISYPLYLWHWPLLSFTRVVDGEYPSPIVRVLLLAIAVGLAFATYVAVEKPIREGRLKKRAPALLALGMIIVGGAGYYCFASAGIPSRPQIEPFKAPYQEFAVGFWKYTTNDLCLNRYRFADAENYGGWWFCITNRDEPPTMILLGNSYANHLFPGFAKNPSFKKHTILSIGTCDPPWQEETDQPLAPDRSPCSEKNRWLQQTFINRVIETAGSIRFAILAGLSLPDETYIARIRKRVDFLEKNGVQVIIFSPHIESHYNIKTCLARPFRAGAKCEIAAQEIANLKNQFQPLVDSISRTNPRVAFFDPNAVFCTDGQCSLVRNGMPLYRDEAWHLSEYGSVELSKIFEAWARVNLPELLGDHP